MSLNRIPENPIITIDDVKPSRPDTEVICAFNSAAAQVGDETVLLIRVAEKFMNDDADILSVPVYEPVNGVYRMVRKDLNVPELKAAGYNFDDPRVVEAPSARDGLAVVYLSSLSHLRVARSKDGIHFDIEEKPFIEPTTEYEAWGCEDPRLTYLDGIYYINYTAVSPLGVATMLATTKDFVTYEKHGLIFAPENRNVCFFPRKVNGKYLAFNRPAPEGIGTPNIWLAESNDMLHWGNQKFFYSVQKDGWETGRIGGGFHPIETEKGWLFIYHAADISNRYCLGAFLLDKNDPLQIIAKSEKPILEPELEYETAGFFGGVVFTCGGYLKENTLYVYYGVADENMALATIELDDLFAELGV